MLYPVSSLDKWKKLFSISQQKKNFSPTSKFIAVHQLVNYLRVPSVWLQSEFWFVQRARRLIRVVLNRVPSFDNDENHSLFHRDKKKTHNSLEKKTRNQQETTVTGGL